jgi:hypothetical protein
MLKDTRAIVKSNLGGMTDFLNLTKLHEILGWALHDFAMVERDPEYKPDMYRWCEVMPYDNLCHVCLAGAVFAHTGGRRDARSNAVLWSAAYDRMAAINELREGNVEQAWRCLHRCPNYFRHPIKGLRWCFAWMRAGLLTRGVPVYDLNGDHWWRSMKKLHKDLIEADI